MGRWSCRNLPSREQGTNRCGPERRWDPTGRRTQGHNARVGRGFHRAAKISGFLASRIPQSITGSPGADEPPWPGSLQIHLPVVSSAIVGSTATRSASSGPRSTLKMGYSSARQACRRWPLSLEPRPAPLTGVDDGSRGGSLSDTSLVRGLRETSGQPCSCFRIGTLGRSRVDQGPRSGGGRRVVAADDQDRAVLESCGRRACKTLTDVSVDDRGPFRGWIEHFD